ncbi:unnamed protein product [Leptidea sinapis]|uniref:Uncharacterized protein n=1 Tax=Leptidea sinapis TaxID=189913 RepID=A0A5E4PXK0_9NEOP|nr:unnamed protein product [Leptidea sinapis]
MRWRPAHEPQSTESVTIPVAMPVYVPITEPVSACITCNKHRNITQSIRHTDTTAATPLAGHFVGQMCTPIATPEHRNTMQVPGGNRTQNSQDNNEWTIVQRRKKKLKYHFL